MGFAEQEAREGFAGLVGVQYCRYSEPAPFLQDIQSDGLVSFAHTDSDLPVLAFGLWSFRKPVDTKIKFVALR